MTLYDIHLILPESTEFDNMPAPLQDQLNALDAKWPSFPGTGTKSHGGKKLIHARVRRPPEYATTRMDVLLPSLFAQFGLTWEVAGIREARETPATYDSEGAVDQPAFYKVVEALDKATILPYMADKIEIDSNGDATTRPAAITDTFTMAMYAGTEEIVLH